MHIRLKIGILIAAFLVLGGGIWFIVRRQPPVNPGPAANLVNNAGGAVVPPAPGELKRTFEQLAADDRDLDGLSDEEEASLGTRADRADTDADGLLDRDEVKIYQTNPLKPDTDGDGMSDRDEIHRKRDPLKR